MQSQIDSPNATRAALLAIVALLALSGLVHAQQHAAGSTVPRTLNFSGVATDVQGKAMPGVAGVTFAIYKDREGGAPLWIETQSVTADSKGHFNAQLGATLGHGIPMALFDTTDSLWLGVTVAGQEEQPRVLLLSVPYALKAADAETLGGLPASAFLLARPPVAGSTPATENAATNVSPALGGTGTANFLPLWTDSSGTLGNSAISQSGTSPTAKLGINLSSPTAALEVQGTGMFHGQVTMPSAGLATASGGKKSYPLDLRAASYNSSTKASVFQNFLWEAEPAANNTANPSGTLNLLFAAGSASPAETGLKIASNGLITFAPGQTFPGGSGTVTSVGLSAPPSDFTVSGSPVTSSGTLALNWTVAPTPAATPNAIVKRDANGLINTQGFISNNNNGVGLVANSPGNAGILGGSSTNIGVEGTSLTGHGVYGLTGKVNVAIGAAYAVYGHNLGLNGVGVHGDTSGNSGIGVSGYAGIGVEGDSASIDGTGAGVVAQGRAGSAGLYATTGTGGWAVNAYNVGAGTGVLAGSLAGFAGFFNGDVQIDGNLSKDSGSFMIDHPLDPANKYLYHSFVESPDMMNIYNGNVTTNAAGEAIVTLPDWFEALNQDFRYQLTVMGQFAQAIVSSKVANHKFAIRTDKPNVEVSWQVTGIRHDAWANAHRIPLEQEKPEKERGFYKHPELYGAPEEKGILWAREPNAVKQWKETRIQAAPNGSRPVEVVTTPPVKTPPLGSNQAKAPE